MSFQSINLGSAPNDGTGDDLRTAGGKINSNFNVLFNRIDLATAESAGLMSADDKAKLNEIDPGATKNAADADLLARANHSGTQEIGTIAGLPAALDAKAAIVHEHSEATPAAAGFMSVADKTKLNGIAASATANATDTQLRDRSTHTGTQAIGTVTGLQAALDGKAAAAHPHPDATTSAAGFMSFADKTKLNGIATGATANQTDAHLLNRANHTGSQAIGTVTGLQAALDGKAGTALATTTTPGLMAAADKVRLERALTEISGEVLTTKAVPVPADQIVIFDSQDAHTSKLVPVSAFATAADMGNIQKLLENI